MSLDFSCSSQKALHYHVTNQNTPTQSHFSSHFFRSKALSCVGIPESTRSVSVSAVDLCNVAHWDWGCFLALACIFNYIWSKFMHLRVQSVSWLVDPSVCHPLKAKCHTHVLLVDWPQEPLFWFALFCLFEWNSLNASFFLLWSSFIFGLCKHFHERAKNLKVLKMLRGHGAWGDFLFHGQVGSCGVRTSNRCWEQKRRRDISLLKTSLLRSAACHIVLFFPLHWWKEISYL